MFGWFRKSRSASVTGGTRMYWWLCLIDFPNFVNIHVFEVKEFIPTQLHCLSDLGISGQLLIQEILGGTTRYWWLYLIDIHNFSNVYVFEVNYSIVDIPTELPCSGNLENPSQLPVLEVLEGFWWLCHGFSQFLQYLCFRSQGIQGIYCWHSAGPSIELNWLSCFWNIPDDATEGLANTASVQW